MGKKDSSNNDLLKFRGVSRRFNLSSKRAKSQIAKDRFAFDQTMQGHDCSKIRQGGDFVVQKRDFFGNKVGEPTIFEVKTGNYSAVGCAGEKAASIRKKTLQDRKVLVHRLFGMVTNWIEWLISSVFFQSLCDSMRHV